METNKISMFAFFSELVDEKGIETAADIVKSYGFTGVEFIFGIGANTVIPSVKTAQIYKEALDRRCLTVPCVSCGCSLIKETSPNAKDHTVIKKLCECVDFAKSLGAPLLHHTLYVEIDKHPSFGYEDSIDAVLDAAEEVAKYAERAGVKIIYEPQGFVFNGKERFLEFYGEMKKRSKNVGICFDVGNTYWVDEEPYELLDSVIKDVLHVHLKDYSINDNSTYKTLSGVGIEEVHIGEGEIRLQEMTRKLTECGYSGFFSVEDATGASFEKKFDSAKNIINH